ncbi:MAG: alcohol dehydrogenase [Firmicutes bacterium]|nr:alcohol dehydrogenase [Bacillota bacterium]
MEFTYHLPVNLIFGQGKAELIGKETAKYGKKALVVTGRSSTKKSGLLNRTIELLKAEGMKAVVFDKVTQNPLTTTAEEGAAFAKYHQCDVVVALGGGSIIDAAKAIALIAVNAGNLSEYLFGKLSTDQALPLVIVPTTCGTGSEANACAVLTIPETNDKKALRYDAVVGKASIIDPCLMTTMPKPVFAAVGFDALCHNMEAYLSSKAQPLTDMMALQGIELLGKYLSVVYEDYGNMKAWEAVTWGSTIGGMVLNNGLAAPHAMEHPVSGLWNIVHGRGLAALTPVIYEESISYAPEKFAVISRLLGGRNENDCVAVIRNLIRKLNLTTSLSAEGACAEDINWLADNCLKVSKAALSNHPANFGRDDLVRIYQKAM